MTQPSVLVAGGAGYVGSHACKALAAAGYRPVVYDNLEFGHERAVRWGPLERGDIGDGRRVRDVIARHSPVALMHFAAYTLVGESGLDPAKYYRNNVAGSFALFEAARAGGVGRVVFSSTCAVYGVPVRETLDESHPLAPISPYGATKQMIERALFDYDAAYGVRSVALRYFNAAGADPDGEIGEDHEPETHLIPNVLKAARPGAQPLTLFGDDYPTADGTCIRDYVHVTDLADAHVAALRRLLAGGESLVCNLGTGRGASVREVIAAVERQVGRPVAVRVGPRRPGDPPVLVAEPARAREALAWAPRRSDLATIVSTAAMWMEKGAPSA